MFDTVDRWPQVACMPYDLDDYDNALGNYSAIVRPSRCNCGVFPQRHCQISPYMPELLPENALRTKCVTLQALQEVVDRIELARRPGAYRQVGDLYAVFFARTAPLHPQQPVR